MSTVSLRGIDVHFERRGGGPRLLFLNGSGASLATTGMLLDPFAERFDLVAHDQRGLGRTSVPTEQPTMADYAADAAALADHVGWPTFRVVGISFGGMVAQELAVTWPERIERLALLCTSPGGPDLSSYPLHERAPLAPTVLDTRFTPSWLETHPADRGLAELFTARRAEERSAGFELQLEARRRHDVVARLGRIAAPTLVAGGRYDGIAPPANSEFIAAAVPGAELRLYEGGHAFFAQDAAALPDVLDFLAA